MVTDVREELPVVTGSLDRHDRKVFSYGHENLNTSHKSQEVNKTPTDTGNVKSNKM